MKFPKFNFLALFSICILMIVLFSGCADVASVEKCVVGDPYGFWYGLWHGLTSTIAWVGSLFDDEIAIYAVNNNGGWYDFGFMLGIGGLSGMISTFFKLIS